MTSDPQIPAQNSSGFQLGPLNYAWILGVIAALGLIWRLHVALTAPWYWDEGYVAEFARALGSFTRPHVGGLWEDGFFPLSSSLLAPLSAMPFACSPWWNAMTGVRLWAIGMDMLALGLVILLAWDRTKPRRALLAAACYALLPFAAVFGGHAFYHHFAVCFLLATLALGRSLFEREKALHISAASLCAGLTCASCYWLWWLPFGWVLLMAWKRPKNWAWGLLWTALPPLAVLAANIWPDPQGAWWSIRGMLETSDIGGPQGAAAWLSALKAIFEALPFLGLGLLGLVWAAAREKGPWPWFLACLACAVLEPIRQRGAFIAAMPYPLLPAAPLAALGAALLTDAALEWKAWRGRLAAAIALLLLFQPTNLTGLDRLGFSPTAVETLKSFLDKNARPGDLVCGMPNFNWYLRPYLRVCEPLEVTISEGRACGPHEADAPASRFAYPCSPDELRYAVVSRVHLLGLFRLPGLALSFLEMERAGWRLVFDDKTFKVYENPRFGLSPDPAVRILQVPDFYRLARDQAAAAGRPGLAAFAESRLKSPR